MKNISKLIGTILDEPPVEHHTSPQGEKFLTLRASFNKLVMDVVVSSCIYQGITGRVEITGDYCTEPARKDKIKYLHTFIYASDIKAVDPSMMETNEINIHAKITSNKDYLVSNDGVELLFLYASTRNVFDKTNVLKLCARGANARMLHNIAPGEWLNCTGYIKEYRDTTEIIINSLEPDEEDVDTIKNQEETVL